MVQVVPHAAVGVSYAAIQKRTLCPRALWHYSRNFIETLLLLLRINREL